MTADPVLLRAPELRGAVVAPGRPVAPGLAPPAVGVSYGFDGGTRLPVPVAYSPDGAVLAVGSDDGGVLICDAASGLPCVPCRATGRRVYAVRFDAASHQLVTGAADLTVRLWDADHGDVRHVIEDVFAGWVWPLLTDGQRGRLVVGDAAAAGGPTLRHPHCPAAPGVARARRTDLRAPRSARTAAGRGGGQRRRESAAGTSPPAPFALRGRGSRRWSTGWRTPRTTGR